MSTKKFDVRIFVLPSYKEQLRITLTDPFEVGDQMIVVTRSSNWGHRVYLYTATAHLDGGEFYYSPEQESESFDSLTKAVQKVMETIEARA